jgi:hypothetical protein
VTLRCGTVVSCPATAVSKQRGPHPGWTFGPVRGDQTEQENSRMDGNPNSTRTIWLALIVIASGLVACVTGVVIRYVGADLPTTMTVVGGAFLASVSLGLAMARFLGNQ